VSAANSSSKPAPWALGVASGARGPIPIPPFYEASPQEGAAIWALKHMCIAQYQLGQTQGDSNGGHAGRPKQEAGS
jgi:hypothetical protein